MKTELFQELKNKYPSQFKNLTHIECGDGWYELIKRCCDTIQYRLNLLEKFDTSIDFYWKQIKEKFSLLRMYKNGADDYISGVVDMAETMSGCICEISGNKGQLRNRKIVDGEIVQAWMKTLSLEEAINEGYFVSSEQDKK